MISQMLSSAAKTESEETMEGDDVLPGLGLGGNSPLQQTHQTQNGCTDKEEMDQVETPVKTVHPVAGDVDEFTGIVVKQEEQCNNGIGELTIEPCVTPTSDKHPYEKANSSEDDEDSPLSDQSDDAGDSDNIPSDVSPNGTLREGIKCESFVDNHTLPPAGVLGTHLKAEMVDASWDCYDQLVPLAINPRGSLLELAQKLRIANKRMWGSDSGNLLASPSNSDKRVNTGSSALQKHLLDTAATSDAESPEKGSPLNNVLLKEKITAVGNQLWKVLLRIDPNDTAASTACNSDALCVRGPSLWPVLAATKDNPLLDYGELVESFKARNTSHAATDIPGLESSTGLTPPLPLNDYQIENIESNAIDFVVKTKVPKLYAKKTAGEMRHVGRKGMLPQDFLPLPRKHRCQYYLCNYQTDNKSHLRRHESSVHCAIKGYFCYVCNKDFSRTEKVKAHFVKMHVGVVYDSKLCRRVALSPSELTGPHRDSTGKFVSPPKLCQDDKECDAVGSAASSSTISSHLAAHLLSDPDVTFMQAYQSLVCDPQHLDACDPAVQPVGDNVAERSHSSYTTPRLLGKKCPHCTYVSRDMWHLKRHLTDVHSEQKAFSCPVCCYSSSRRHRLMTHLVTHGVLYCLYCAFSADDLDAFRTHQRVCTQQHGATTLTCMFCGERCAGETELQDHASLVHQSHFYICESCPFFTGNVAAFETHQQQHSSEQHCDESLPESANQPVAQKPKSMGNVGLFNCPHCDFTSKYRNVLRKHLSRHPGEIYTCGVAGCDYRTTDRSLLERHTRGQHGQQVETLSYPCPMCLRPPFKYKRSLEKHILNHMATDEKCAVCGARFLLKAQLDKHMETEHVETEHVETKHIETEHMESEPTETKHSVTEHTETEQTDAEHMETEHTEHTETEHTATEHTATEHTDAEHTATEHTATGQTEHMDTEDTATEHSVTEQTEHVETKPTVTDPTQTEHLESEHKTIDAGVSSDDAGSDLSHLDDVNDTRGATDDPVVGLGDQVETPLTAIDGDVSTAMTLTNTGGASIDS